MGQSSYRSYRGDSFQDIQKIIDETKYNLRDLQLQNTSISTRLNYLNVTGNVEGTGGLGIANGWATTTTAAAGSRQELEFARGLERYLKKIFMNCRVNISVVYVPDRLQKTTRISLVPSNGNSSVGIALNLDEEAIQNDPRQCLLNAKAGFKEARKQLQV